ncbi:MAG: hypothetical protein AUI08_08715 [Gemmatimonadetes bacterium 13_2_20CM_2_65_7]|nr:MAG: hypothetical protein AUI08_08715 [Gemmatimonadetes bacterium 13_2_20CM_2_65_7]
MNPVLQVQDLRYELLGDGRALVDGVSFTVGVGETLVLLGRSGSGKTTTLKLVNRLLVPTNGAVLIAGEPEDRIERRVRELLVLVGLDPDTFGARFPHQLSGGQRQRVGVARALAVDPPLLLLDEPFGALDPITRLELQREFRGLQGRLGKAMVFVTHDVREGLLLGTRLGLLDAGRLIFLGTPDEFRASALPEVRQFMEAA